MLEGHGTRRRTSPCVARQGRGRGRGRGRRGEFDCLKGMGPGGAPVLVSPDGEEAVLRTRVGDVARVEQEALALAHAPCRVELGCDCSGEEVVAGHGTCCPIRRKGQGRGGRGGVRVCGRVTDSVAADAGSLVALWAHHQRTGGQRGSGGLRLQAALTPNGNDGRYSSRYQSPCPDR